MPPRKLSSEWRNVIRRQMRATYATEHRVSCSDCDSVMRLAEGRYGRFYRCSRCTETLSADLDGTPRQPKQPRALERARKRAREAVGLMCRQRDHLSRQQRDMHVEKGCFNHCKMWWCSCGRYFGGSTHPTHVTYGDTRHDLSFVFKEAGLGILKNRGRRGSRFAICLNAMWDTPDADALQLKRRTVEECKRVELAADRRYLWLVEELNLAKRRNRVRASLGTAWDFVYIGTLDEAME